MFITSCCVSVAGALATAGVLMGGLVAFKKGNKALSQTMMRARIIAQGATVAIMLGSSGRFTPLAAILDLFMLVHIFTLFFHAADPSQKMFFICRVYGISNLKFHSRDSSK